MELVSLISTIIWLLVFIMYDKTQEKYIRLLKSKINELNKKVERQQEIIDTFYGNNSIE